MENKDFGAKFESDEQVWAALDKIVDVVGSAIQKDEARIGMIAPLKIAQMEFVYKVLEYLTRDTDAELSYEFNKPFVSMGYISLEAEELVFDNSEWFSKACGFASNVEVYPLADGRVRMTFTFHGVVKPIE